MDNMKEYIQQFANYFLYKYPERKDITLFDFIQWVELDRLEESKKNTEMYNKMMGIKKD